MSTGAAGEGTWVLGVDSGGSGLRVALGWQQADVRASPRPVGSVTCAEPVRTNASGIDPAHMAEQLVPAVRTLLDEAEARPAPGSGIAAAAGARRAPQPRIAAACVGAAGMATLGDGLRAELPGLLAREFRVRRSALAADAVTAYAGALGERPGAVVAAGTGMIAMGTDLATWRRADGWGHLLGDCGSGAWIGRAGLEAALRAHDGRAGGSAALRDRAESVFGAPLSGLPGRLYPRTDRPAVLASFAPEVARCAERDHVAAGILRAAAREIAGSAVAVCPSGDAACPADDKGPVRPSGGEVPGEGPREARGVTPVRVAFTGGLFAMGEPLTEPLRNELAERLPQARVVEAAGGPLDGALLLAGRLATGGVALPPDPALLHLTDAPGAA
ncbi:N-acetylglucosamine kinase [Streptomyces reniochalinae]|uniref:ATPase n=1 Tax=Streptomyces reniochalinae TaxID=2250578 RepID=A0A367EVQ2_9ACTN|nr:BadF/BadG/BcrA/BcrD ATPase family protein [Streptomyces reniochalinae]RCG21665.1 ATPase [Streptomyces reniochalinae]